MRIHALSDIHTDYQENYNWLENLSSSDYRDDILILAGDISDNTLLVGRTFNILKKKFKKVLYVPGNHDLWVKRNRIKDSLTCFNIIQNVAKNFGIETGIVKIGYLTIVPLLGWYDYSFGNPDNELKYMWADYHACVWPDDMDEKSATTFFLALNHDNLNIKSELIISYSHFLPRIDIMPSYIPQSKRIIYPALGSRLLDEQIRRLGSKIHIYGHSHVNVNVSKDGIQYINNAFGYPHETRITAKKLLTVYEM